MTDDPDLHEVQNYRVRRLLADKLQGTRSAGFCTSCGTELTSQESGRCAICWRTETQSETTP